MSSVHSELSSSCFNRLRFPKFLNWLSFTSVVQGNRRPFVVETVKADDDAKFGMYYILMSYQESQC